MGIENFFDAYNLEDPNSYDHWFAHRLGIVIRFVDVFTGRVIDSPMRVSVPDQEWIAVKGKTDATYRFLFTEQAVPAGNFTVEVISLTQEYQNLQVLQISLPVVPSIPPLRSDFIVEHPLWPTRKFKIPAGESAVTGRIVSGGVNAVDDLQIRFYEQGTLPSAAPAAFSDAQGEFVYRLPWYSYQVAGSVVSPPPDIDIEITGTGGVITPINPASIHPEPGLVHAQTITIP